MYIVGDIHGDFEWYHSQVLENESINESIQIGDYGVGFGYHIDKALDHDCLNHKFFCGNHDNPAVAKHMDSWLGAFGEIHTIDGYFISGAHTPYFDVQRRTNDINYWLTEELNAYQLQLAIKGCLAMKPKVILSHVMPAFLAQRLCQQSMPGCGYSGSKTEYALEFIFREWQPKLWISGHYHIPYDQIIQGTRFVVIEPNKYIKLEDYL